MSNYLLSTTIVLFNPDMKEMEPILKNVMGAMSSAAKKFNKNCILYLVDNSETDHARIPLIETIETFDLEEIAVEYIFSGDNLGYGKANNLLLEKLDSNYHLMINPDVIFQKETLSDAIEVLQKDPKLGLLSPAVYSPEGEQQHFCKNNPTFFVMFLRSMAPSFIKKLFQWKLDKFENKALDYSKSHRNIPFLSGCFLLFKTGIFKQLKGFDPRFFLYFEDADITRRTLKIADSIYEPSIKITHEWSRGAHNNPALRKLAIKSGLQYCWKWLL